MEAAAYDALDAAGVEAAVAAGTLSKDEAIAHERGRVVPRPEVLAALGVDGPGGTEPPAAEGTQSQAGIDGPQDPTTVPGPSTPAQLAVQHGTQDEPRDYQASEVAVSSATGTEDEPRGYLAPQPETD